MRKTLLTLAMLTLGAATNVAAHAETVVTCNGPVTSTNGGEDGSAPRFTLVCTGGSSAAGIDYFAFQISTNPTVALLMEQGIGNYLTSHKGKAITLQSNLSDTSGSAWGCGESNCRILDYTMAD